MVGASAFISGTYMCRHSLYTHVKYYAYMTYMTNFAAILVSGSLLAITCEAEVAVGCVLAYTCKMLSLHAHVAC